MQFNDANDEYDYAAALLNPFDVRNDSVRIPSYDNTRTITLKDQ